MAAFRMIIARMAAASITSPRAALMIAAAISIQ
jgi:hypothetical protein